jgi:predicted regulator of Ras-like GTPase activity (Roadblock/LC7/MglB family)
MQTTDNSLTWLLQGLLERVPGARHALVLSRDGLKLCWTEHLALDQVEFGDGTGGVRHSMTEFHGGQLFIVQAGDGAHLALLGEESADPGVVGHQMTELVEQIGEHLRAEPRGGAQGSTSS